MKKIGFYFLIGCISAIGGIIFSAIWGQFFNGMDFGSAREDHSDEDEKG